MFAVFSLAYYVWLVAKYCSPCTEDPSCMLCMYCPPQSYSRRRGFVAAQSPLATTRNDAWQLMWQLKAKTIVLLCSLKEGKKVEFEVSVWHTLSITCIYVHKAGHLPLQEIVAQTCTVCVFCRKCAPSFGPKSPMAQQCTHHLWFNVWAPLITLIGM